MSILRGLLGFIIGMAVSGAALTLFTAYMPLILGTATPVPESLVQDEAPAATTTQETSTPEANSKEPVTEQPAVEVVEEEQKVETPKAEPVVAEPEQLVVVAEPVEEKQPVVETAEPQAPAIVVEEEPEVAPVVQVEETQPELAEVPKTVSLPTIDTTKPVDEPAAVVEESAADTGITVGKKPSSKLPTITQEAPNEVVEEVTQENIEDAAADNALEFNATDFERDERPLLGVILLDIGADGLDVDKLKKLNAPITIAILADASDASERALEYNDAGFEVIAMASDDNADALKKANNAAQVQNALDVTFSNVPHAIGLMDNEQGSLQKNNRMSGEIVNSLKATGHGLVTFAKGLNAIDRVAGAAGVRSAKIERAIDAKGEGKIQMVRYLDRASLDAGRDGSVIILGTTTKETVATIAVWLLSSKGQNLAIAPASAVLLME
jgi:polysaccharide deacetylase 2 family uncharacterized protein YibQ